jgi:anti-anti-sigma factor
MPLDPGGFSISTSEHDGRAVIVLRGELDLATAPRFEEVVDERLNAGLDVIVDVRELQFMDSSGLRVLVAAHARTANGQRFLIVRPPAGGAIQKVLAIAGLESELDFVDEA